MTVFNVEITIAFIQWLDKYILYEWTNQNENIQLGKGMGQEMDKDMFDQFCVWMAV